MELYIGTKTIKAKPMTRGEYNKLNVGPINQEGNPTDPGYMVGYTNAVGKFDGSLQDGCHYISWSPADVFEASYRHHCDDPITDIHLSFGSAIEALKAGKKVAKIGWNGRDMWLVLMSGMSLSPYNTQGTERKVNDRTAKWIGKDTPLVTLPYIAMWTADQKWLPGWLASQTDMLADDWMIIK